MTLTKKMFIHTAVIILLKSKKVAEVTQSSKNIIKIIRKLEELDYRLRKAEVGFQFVCKCDDSNVLPNFLNFCLKN